MARLDITHPPELAQMLSLSPGCVLGRDEEATLHVALRGLSRRHARFDWDGRRWTLTDLGSHNGTRCNGVPVASTTLQDGDQLVFGPLTATFVSEPSISHSEPAVSLLSFPKSAEHKDPERLAEDYELLRAAHEVAFAIGGCQTAEEVYQAALAFCAERFSVDAGYVLARTEETPFQICAQSGESLRTSSKPLPVSTTVLARLVYEQRGFLLSDAELELGAVSVLSLQIESLLAVPIVTSDVVLGAVVLHNHRRKRAFDRRDLYVISGIAAQVSLVLDRLRLLEEIRRETAIRASFARFLPQELVEELVSGRLSAELGGREGLVSVLYCDIRGFTPLSRSLGPAPTMALLNAYYQACVPVVFAHGGMVDKFVGDELMAVFGVPHARPDDLQRAIACALSLQQTISALGCTLEREGLARFACGIGINAGPALVGLLGAAERVQYTVIGDTINLGARLCGAAGPGEIVTRAELLAAYGGRFEPMPPTRLKGIDATLSLARILSGASLADDVGSGAAEGERS